jgi:hypothetical protein
LYLHGAEPGCGVHGTVSATPEALVTRSTVVVTSILWLL